MSITWDPAKAAANCRKHGVSFEVAQTVFDDRLHLSVLDDRERGEERWVTVGQAVNENMLVVVHIYSVMEGGRENVRIISTRKATRREVKQYEEGI